MLASCDAAYLAGCFFFAGWLTACCSSALLCCAIKRQQHAPTPTFICLYALYLTCITHWSHTRPVQPPAPPTHSLITRINRHRQKRPWPGCYTFGSPPVLAHSTGGGTGPVLQALGLPPDAINCFVLEADPVPRALLSVDPTFQLFSVSFCKAVGSVCTCMHEAWRGFSSVQPYSGQCDV